METKNTNVEINSETLSRLSAIDEKIELLRHQKRIILQTVLECCGADTSKTWEIYGNALRQINDT